MNLLYVFIILNVVNVIIQTAKSLITLKGSPIVAALSNAVAYGLYTVVLVYMNCDLPLWQKSIIVAICNLIGVYIVKFIEEKAKKDKLWKIELTSNFDDKEFDKLLKERELPYTKIPTYKQDIFIYNIFCRKKEDTDEVRKLAKQFKSKYFVIESKD